MCKDRGQSSSTTLTDISACGAACTTDILNPQNQMHISTHRLSRPPNDSLPQPLSLAPPQFQGCLHDLKYSLKRKLSKSECEFLHHNTDTHRYLARITACRVSNRQFKERFSKPSAHISQSHTVSASNDLQHTRRARSSSQSTMEVLRIKGIDDLKNFCASQSTKKPTASAFCPWLGRTPDGSRCASY